MHPVSDNPTDRHLRPNAAAVYLGIAISTFFKYAKYEPHFPKGIKLSARCTVYRQSELDAYLQRKASQSKAAA